MTWGNIKKGDAVIEVYAASVNRERRRESVATSVGKKWITTTDGTRYSAETGYGQFGWTLHTAATLDERRRRDAAERTIRDARLGLVSLANLEGAAALLTSEPSR